MRTETDWSVFPTAHKPYAVALQELVLFSCFPTALAPSTAPGSHRQAICKGLKGLRVASNSLNSSPGSFTCLLNTTG